MTCIVGLVHQGAVLIGGDSAGVAGYSITARVDQKVFTRHGYAFGFCGSFRMGQLLRYEAELPDPADPLMSSNPDGFMVAAFIPLVRKALKAGGFTSVEDNVETGGLFLVGVRGRLYAIDSDFQIGRSRDNYMAVGCGEDLALGALRATRKQDLEPRQRIRTALDAATHHSAGVCRPFKIVSTP